MENLEQGNSAVDASTTDNNAVDTSLASVLNNASAESTPEVKPDGDKTEGTDNSNDGKATEHPAWMQQLPEEMRNNSEVVAQLSKFAKIGDMAKSYTELESKLGKSLIQPGEDASAEERQAFYEKLGKPSSADGYSIQDENASALKKLFFDNNLTDDQAKNIYGEMRKLGENAVRVNKEALEKQAAETEKNLRAKYGASYNQKIQMLQKGIKTYGGQELLNQLKASGLLAKQNICEMYILLGEQASEAGSFTGSANNGESYKTSLEGGHFDFKYD